MVVYLIPNKKLVDKPEGIVATLFEQQTGNAVTQDCANTVTYPAVQDSIVISKQCLLEKEDNRSWFEKVFGE